MWIRPIYKFVPAQIIYFEWVIAGLTLVHRLVHRLMQLALAFALP